MNNAMMRLCQYVWRIIEQEISNEKQNKKKKIFTIKNNEILKRHHLMNIQFLSADWLIDSLINRKT